MRLSVCLACLLCMIGVATRASAQSPEAVVSYDYGVFAAGVNPSTGSPVSAITNFLTSAVTCGLSPKQANPGTVTNPTKVYFDDPANPSTADCEWNPAAASGYLQGLPLGSGFLGYLRAHGATTVSAWSAASNPFNHQAVSPAVPTGIRETP